MRLQYYGGGGQTNLADFLPLSEGDSFVVKDGSLLPPAPGNDLPFVLTIDRGTVREEKIVCRATGGNVVFIEPGGRGYDGTSATDHPRNATVVHIIDTQTLNDFASHIYQEEDVHGISSEMLLEDATPSLGPVGSIVAKVPVYDTSGATPSLVGYLPVYNNIS